MDCSERHLFEPFIYTMIILPRQARDKHRESTQKKMRFPHRFATHVIWIVNNIYNDIILYIYILFWLFIFLKWIVRSRYTWLVGCPMASWGPMWALKTALVFVECFPYVCPEPVLVKWSFLYINGSKKPFLPATESCSYDAKPETVDAIWY